MVDSLPEQQVGHEHSTGDLQIGHRDDRLVLIAAGVVYTAFYERAGGSPLPRAARRSTRCSRRQRRRLERPTSVPAVQVAVSRVRLIGPAQAHTLRRAAPGIEEHQNAFWFKASDLQSVGHEVVTAAKNSTHAFPLITAPKADGYSMTS
jgi:hypothetical protein